MKPAYTQVKEFVQQHISSGQWRPGAPVPSEAAHGVTSVQDLTGRSPAAADEAEHALEILAAVLDADVASYEDHAGEPLG